MHEQEQAGVGSATRRCVRCRSAIEVPSEQAAGTVNCPNCSAPIPARNQRRQIASGFLVAGADRPERRSVWPLIALVLLLAGIGGLVLWEPWNSIPVEVVDTDPVEPQEDKPVQEDADTKPFIADLPVRQAARSLKSLGLIPKPDLVWTGGNLPKLRLPRGAKTQIASSGIPAKFVALDGVVYSVADGKQLADFTPEEPVAITSLSADGQRLAIVSGAVIRVHSVSSPDARPNAIALGERDLPVRFVAFAGDSLVAQCGIGIDANIRMWHASTGDLIESIPQGVGDASRTVVSPDGSLVAIAKSHAIEIRSGKTGEVRCVVETPVGASAVPMSNLDGLAFSPDSRILAGLLRGNRIVAWHRDGRILMDHSVYGVQADTSQSSIVPRLQWLPDGTGWLLHGRTLCMADPVMVVWRIDHSSSYRGFQNLLVDRNHVFVGGGNEDSGMLVGVTVPWVKVNEAREQVLKRPWVYGAAVPVKVNIAIDHLRFDSLAPDVVSRKLEAVLQERLRQEGLQIDGEANLALTLKYNEEASTSRRSLSNIRPVVPSTKVSLEVAIHPRGQSLAFWRDGFVSDSGESKRGFVTIQRSEYVDEVGLRNKAVNAALAWIRGLDLPTVIPNDPAGQLPVISVY